MNLKYSKFTFSQFQKDFIWSNFEILEIHLNFDLRIFLYCFKFMQKIESLAFGRCLSITLKLKLVDLLLNTCLFLDTLWLLAMSQIIQRIMYSCSPQFLTFCDVKSLEYISNPFLDQSQSSFCRILKLWCCFTLFKFEAEYCFDELNFVNRDTSLDFLG